MALPPPAAGGGAGGPTRPGADPDDADRDGADGPTDRPEGSEDLTGPLLGGVGAGRTASGTTGARLDAAHPPGAVVPGVDADGRTGSRTARGAGGIGGATVDSRDLTQGAEPDAAGGAVRAGAVSTREGRDGRLLAGA